MNAPVNLRPEFWRDRRVLVTGHTGFKGSWLCLWLDHVGARVTGFALAPPTDPSLFDLARVAERVDHRTGDVRDLDAVTRTMRDAAPEIVIHMAAQSLVRYSYEHPVETFSTNVLGTVHVLEAVRAAPSVRAVVAVTSDKCYRNEEWVWGYRENDRLGGHDPYSGSKGAAEIAVEALRSSFFEPGRDPTAPAVATARAGNVIGGGDWAADRLVPDIVRSLLLGEATPIRNPRATRPWQFVLEPLHGYLLLAERLFEDGHGFAGAWNFGPSEEGERTVGWIAERLQGLWGETAAWRHDPHPGPPESTFLKLDASKARARLGWRPKLDLETTLAWIVEWTRRFEAGEDAREACLDAIRRYEEIA